MTAAQEFLRNHSDPQKAATMRKFFKNCQDDIFLGVGALDSHDCQAISFAFFFRDSQIDETNVHDHAITNIQSAVSYLGVNTLKNLVLSVEIFRAFKPQKELPGFSLEKLQHHAQLTTQIAGRLPRAQAPLRHCDRSGHAPRRGQIDPRMENVRALRKGTGGIVGGGMPRLYHRRAPGWIQPRRDWRLPPGLVGIALYDCGGRRASSRPQPRAASKL